MVMIGGYSVGSWMRAPFATYTAFRADALGEVVYPAAMTAARTTPRSANTIAPGGLDTGLAQRLAAPQLGPVKATPFDEKAFRARYLDSDW